MDCGEVDYDDERYLFCEFRELYTTYDPFEGECDTHQPTPGEIGTGLDENTQFYDVYRLHQPTPGLSVKQNCRTQDYWTGLDPDDSIAQKQCFSPLAPSGADLQSRLCTAVCQNEATATHLGCTRADYSTAGSSSASSPTSQHLCVGESAAVQACQNKADHPGCVGVAVLFPGDRTMLLSGSASVSGAQECEAAGDSDSVAGDECEDTIGLNRAKDTIISQDQVSQAYTKYNQQTCVTSQQATDLFTPGVTTSWKLENATLGTYNLTVENFNETITMTPSINMMDFDVERDASGVETGNVVLKLRVSTTLSSDSGWTAQDTAVIDRQLLSSKFGSSQSIDGHRSEPCHRSGSCAAPEPDLWLAKAGYDNADLWSEIAVGTETYTVAWRHIVEARFHFGNSIGMLVNSDQACDEILTASSQADASFSCNSTISAVETRDDVAARNKAFMCKTTSGNADTSGAYITCSDDDGGTGLFAVLSQYDQLESYAVTVTTEVAAKKFGVEHPDKDFHFWQSGFDKTFHYTYNSSDPANDAWSTQTLVRGSPSVALWQPPTASAVFSVRGQCSVFHFASVFHFPSATNRGRRPRIQTRPFRAIGSTMRSRRRSGAGSVLTRTPWTPAGQFLRRQVRGIAARLLRRSRLLLRRV